MGMVNSAKIIKLPFKDKVHYNGLTDEMISERELALQKECSERKEKNKLKKRNLTKLQSKCIWYAINTLTNNS